MTELPSNRCACNLRSLFGGRRLLKEELAFQVAAIALAFFTLVMTLLRRFAGQRAACFSARLCH
jgi:hypothetical protein